MNNQELTIEYEFLPSKDNALRVQKAYRLIFEKIGNYEREKRQEEKNNDK